MCRSHYLDKSKIESIDSLKFTVVERTVTELSHMDAGEQVEVAETTLAIAVVKYDNKDFKSPACS
jgi:hypothetical protein